MAEGVDYSWARPGGAALRAAGKTFVVRYLYPGGGKGLTASELADLRAHGLAVAVVYESSANRALSGRAAGQADARTAQGQLNTLGLPALPVYFAVDFDARASQQPAIDEYLRGAADVIGRGRVGIYAGIGPVQRAQANGTASWYWQTYAWSGGRVAPGIHLYQYRNGQKINGGGVDFVRSLATNFGQVGEAGGASPASANSSDVRAYQTQLNRLGYGLVVDGIHGPKTDAAVRDFQAKHGLVVDGIVGPKTRAALAVALVPAPAPGTPSRAATDRVRAYQTQLNRLGYSLVVDGIHGPKTDAAVRDFQAKHGLVVDGIVGPKTSGALAATLARPQIAVDGIRGAETIKAEQRALGVTPDGIFGPISIRAEQRHVGAAVDGIRGRDTIRHLQAHLGVTQDGIEGPITIRAEQARLNAGTF